MSQSKIADALASLPLKLPYATTTATVTATGQSLDDDLERLQIDYCQLLIGPKGHLSPVESVWVSDQFQSKSVDAMQSFFDLLTDYQPPDGFHDHIGVQLDFAGHVLQSADRAGKDFEQADDLVNVFVLKRLAWTPPLLQKVKQQAQTTFYRQLAEATERWLDFFNIKQM